MKNESRLKDHKQNKKKLNPPLLAGGMNIQGSSWYDERLPEMLWAVLIVGNIEREEALKFFRYIAKFIHDNQDCFDITLTGISKLLAEKRELFIKYFVSYSEDINKILQSLILFPKLPGFSDWEKVLSKSNPNENWRKISKGIAKSFWHQSQEATDCRWIKILCQILGGKINFPKEMKDDIQGILEYPRFGDMRKVRPSIRALEITFAINKENSELNWSEYFWKYCFDHTGCIPEEAVSKKIEKRQKKLSDEMEYSRKHYFDKTAEIRKNLIDHFFASSKNSTIDARQEGAFGLTLYAFSLFIEVIFYRTSLSITGRLGLRALVETYITFSYLLKKEKIEPRVWDDYRLYGTGQIKMIYLKLQEMNQKLSSIDLDEMENIANEDKWVEFVPINLGHWDSVSLRKMAEDVKLTKLYDKFYNYTSGFMHGNWGAVRESIYQKCINPLHRYHRVPIFDLPLMPSVTKDAQAIMNLILECLSKAYPTFEQRITYNKGKSLKRKTVKI